MLEQGANGHTKNTNPGRDSADQRASELPASRCSPKDFFLDKASSHTEWTVSEDFSVCIRVMLTDPAAVGLAQLTTEKIATSMQVDEFNPMVGLEGRASLLTNLGKALEASPRLFGHDARPGNLIG
jgi:hypothetical protein